MINIIRNIILPPGEINRDNIEKLKCNNKTAHLDINLSRFINHVYGVCSVIYTPFGDIKKFKYNGKQNRKKNKQLKTLYNNKITVKLHKIANSLTYIIINKNIFYDNYISKIKILYCLDKILASLHFYKFHIESSLKNIENNKHIMYDDNIGTNNTILGYIIKGMDNLQEYLSEEEYNSISDVKNGYDRNDIYYIKIYEQGFSRKEEKYYSTNNTGIVLCKGVNDEWNIFICMTNTGNDTTLDKIKYTWNNLKALDNLYL